MNLQWSRTRALLVGVALIVFTNAVVLAGVAYNRSGEPEAALPLTERELKLRDWSWPENDNSSIDLYLRWRVLQVERGPEEPYINSSSLLHWLPPERLPELGFDVSGNMQSDEDSQRVARQPSRRAWLVLEFDGPAYRTSLERSRKTLEQATSLAQANAGDEDSDRRLKYAQRSLELEERFESRLFIVDAALDADALRARYPDRRQYAVVRGRLDITVQGSPGRLQPFVYVSDVDVAAIRVPHAYRDIVEPLLPSRARDYYNNIEPRFAATVNFGKRFEPWIVNLQSLQTAQP